MVRTNLAPATLQLKALGISNVVHFEFMDAPPAEALIRALELLYSLGAVDDECNLVLPPSCTCLFLCLMAADFIGVGDRGCALWPTGWMACSCATAVSRVTPDGAAGPTDGRVSNRAPPGCYVACVAEARLLGGDAHHCCVLLSRVAVLSGTRSQEAGPLLHRSLCVCVCVA